ncbi:hypothetical protein DQ04_02751080 [Trypanosoma grayi]|uniref:hypothetical protein n=1 Tax=Trypanosoma grayi TaxID=71804 RepID=UPI0004F3F728|nr:hypothetical protein DQ04_02751080 [Trypanosoma grayi]KEG11310.1 hypothetical protein DQ04_02751080 [Trypanosoma grayi]
MAQTKLFAPLHTRASQRRLLLLSSPSYDGALSTAVAAFSSGREGATPVERGSSTSYGDCIDRYIHDLEAHCRVSGEAVVNAQKRFDSILAERATAQAEHRREYMKTFIPLVFVIILFMREQTNRGCAEKTHLVLKEHAEKCSSIKRVAL